VLELRPRDVAVITCVGDPSAVEALGMLTDVATCRVAPDEAMLLTTPDRAVATVEDASARAIAADPDAMILDATDGWAAWTLRGDGVDVAFGRLSAVPLPRGFAQGDVAHVPAKIVATEDTLDLLVPAMWGDCLRERILARCDGVVERTEPVAWGAPEGDLS
jgi:hypothetical protein